MPRVKPIGIDAFIEAWEGCSTHAARMKMARKCLGSKGGKILNARGTKLLNARILLMALETKDPRWAEMLKDRDDPKITKSHETIDVSHTLTAAEAKVKLLSAKEQNHIAEEHMENRLNNKFPLLDAEEGVYEEINEGEDNAQ